MTDNRIHVRVIDVNYVFGGTDHLAADHIMEDGREWEHSKKWIPEASQWELLRGRICEW